jgi:hypothetical protein
LFSISALNAGDELIEELRVSPDEIKGRTRKKIAADVDVLKKKWRT